MKWLTDFFTSSLGRKLLVTLSGLFLCLFLIIHLYGNLNILWDDTGEMFNRYSYKMSHTWFIKVASIITWATILLHIIISLALSAKNQTARGVAYKVKKGSGTLWTSRNMAVLGTIIFAFLVLHLSNFWYKFKFGADLPNALLTVNGEAIEIIDYYTVVEASFQQLWYVVLYIISMAAVAFHLFHGFQSAFQTLGINHKKYTPVIKGIGYGFSILIPLAFAAIPIYMYLNHASI